MVLQEGTPESRGFKMPAEWDAHEGTWLGWPQNAADWPGKFAAIPWVYAEIVRLLSQHENVHILVNSDSVRSRAESILKRAGAKLDSVSFHVWSTDRVWLRDSGPIFVKDTQGALAITDWKFNAWAKYDDWRKDDQVPSHVAKLSGLPRWQPMAGKHRLVLEGGSIDVNGAGTLITTEECLLSEVQQRNPGVSREALEAAFHDYLGIEQVLWMDRGVAGDDTHGHVDDITRFVGSTTIVWLSSQTLPTTIMPRWRRIWRGSRLPARRKGSSGPWLSFLCRSRWFFAGNGCRQAMRISISPMGWCWCRPSMMQTTASRSISSPSSFPSREVIGIHAVDLVWGLGTLHCMTQQQPAAG